MIMFYEKVAGIIGPVSAGGIFHQRIPLVKGIYHRRYRPGHYPSSCVQPGKRFGPVPGAHRDDQAYSGKRSRAARKISIKTSEKLFHQVWLSSRLSEMFIR